MAAYIVKQIFFFE